MTSEKQVQVQEQEQEQTQIPFGDDKQKGTSKGRCNCRSPFGDDKQEEKQVQR
jgi:hypothetical protein